MRTLSIATIAAFLALLLAGCASPDPQMSDERTENGSDATAPPSPSDVDAPTPTGTESESVPTSDAASGRVSSTAGSPLVVTLELADAAAFLGEGTTATLVLHGEPVATLRAGLSLPDGVEVVSGNLSYEGPLADDAPVSLVATLRARAPGDHVLRAWAERPAPPGSRIAPSALLGVSGDATSARFFAPDPPARSIACELTASEDGRTARVRIVPERDVAARLSFVVPEALGNAPPARELALVAGRPVEHSIALAEPAPWEGDGYVVLSALVYPDPAVDGRLCSDSLYYRWAEGRLVVSESPPDASTGSGAGAGPATSGEGNATPRSTP